MGAMVQIWLRRVCRCDTMNCSGVVCLTVMVHELEHGLSDSQCGFGVLEPPLLATSVEDVSGLLFG